MQYIFYHKKMKQTHIWHRNKTCQKNKYYLRHEKLRNVCRWQLIILIMVCYVTAGPFVPTIGTKPLPFTVFMSVANPGICFCGHARRSVGMTDVWMSPRFNGHRLWDKRQIINLLKYSFGWMTESTAHDVNWYYIITIACGI